MQALVDIVHSGKALYVGISNYPLNTLQFVFSYLKERDVPCLIYQGKYNIFHRQPETEGILEACKEAGVPIVSSMGAGNKLDPTAFEVTDIYKTTVCPLAKVMRKELKARGIKKLKVVYSKEIPLEPIEDEDFVSDEVRRRRSTPGSIAFVPSVAGLILAGEVVKDISGTDL